MAAIIDEYLDTTMEQEDVFPCKGCGEILEEGKAYELAGNRWHLDCFRCNTCHTLLDSDANLLLLGDGSLICSNCTYSCSACGNKIEDLAILTGDQAFCSTCFRCRNCKRKIENLRYARTSLGIFCMGCHETIIAKKRKKSKAAASAKSREKESPMITEKSLPALPPTRSPKALSPMTRSILIPIHQRKFRLDLAKAIDLPRPLHEIAPGPPDLPSVRGRQMVWAFLEIPIEATGALR
uniref:LIM zinc-binding domain-containing protein n=1 Tax=Bionectria ochroleuca TaxID=29856 RepID=A0A8H7TVU8_BIOOC